MDISFELLIFFIIIFWISGFASGFTVFRRR
jgi:hypothetical protein